MPSRILREGIIKSERVNSLDWFEEVFYRRLMSIVDDYGRAEAACALLRAGLFPLRLEKVREADVSRGLAACEKAGLVRLYVVSGKRYLQLIDFGQRQQSKSRYPPPPAADYRGPPEFTVNHGEPPLPTVGHGDSPESTALVGVGVGVVSPPPDLHSKTRSDPESPSRGTSGLDEVAWNRWLEYRTKIRRPLKPVSMPAAQRKLAAFGADQAAVVEQSVANGWQGLFALKTPPPSSERARSSAEVVSMLEASRARTSATEAEAKAAGKDIWALPGEPGYMGVAK